MSIHKLHIFAKNRDAIAAQKGYSYQQLKTLEDWLENRVAGGDEDIYCDFEDDILSKDLLKGKTIFKQIKLYSKDFSFSSESITKTIAHFFSLYTKGEYIFDQVEFHFETNVSVVGKTVKDNDAALLEEWYKNQDSISADLLKRIRVRIKRILNEYIEERVEELSNVEFKSDVQIAQNIYANLKNEDFDAFIHCIKWRFDGEQNNEAVEHILSDIEELISKISLPLDGDKTKIYSSLLVNEVFQRSIQDDPEDRKLTKELLDDVLLNAGDREDKWYAETIRQFRGITIQYFYQGEFQTAISAARYCRINQLDYSHISLWLSVLKQYINLKDIPVANNRKAIYEYLFLQIGYNLLQKSDSSPIADEAELINYYIENWKPVTRVQDLEDDIVLLQLVKSQIKVFGLSFLEDLILKWEDSIKVYLESEVAKEKNVDRLCELLEMQGHLASQSAVSEPIKSYKAAFDYYRKIPPLLEKAQYYSLSPLYAQMQQMVKMLTEYGLDDELLDLTDQFMSEIQEYAGKTGLRHKTAHEYVERAVLHIGHHDLPNYLKALELFHKAKDKWRLEYTKEGYILSLLGIARVYEGLGMTYASKYYSLLAVWSTWHSADPKLYKHLQKAISQVMQHDYKHGAWMNAINDFDYYLILKREFDEKGFEMDNDESYNRAVFELASIIYAAPLIHPPMTEFIEALKPQLGSLWTDQIFPLIEVMSSKISDVNELKHLLHQKLNDLPLNDIGLIRNIHFTALGNDWHIQFENNDVMTPIGEEFVSFLQVTLCEIARINPDILNNGGKRISITVKKGHFQKHIEEPDKWIVTNPEFDSKEQPDIKKHYMYIGALVTAILQNTSKLSKIEFNQFYVEELLKKGKLGEKAFEGSSYQRILRNTVGHSIELTKQKPELPSLENESLPLPNKNWLIENE
ncbi:MAG TPA: hypothetical protein DCM71_04570 [Runella sp.]|nr:hypothetical protein [Runella sp.]